MSMVTEARQLEEEGTGGELSGRSAWLAPAGRVGTLVPTAPSRLPYSAPMLAARGRHDRGSRHRPCDRPARRCQQCQLRGRLQFNTSSPTADHTVIRGHYQTALFVVKSLQSLWNKFGEASELNHSLLLITKGEAGEARPGLNGKGSTRCSKLQ